MIVTRGMGRAQVNTALVAFGLGADRSDVDVSLLPTFHFDVDRAVRSMVALREARSMWVDRVLRAWRAERGERPWRLLPVAAVWTVWRAIRNWRAE